MGKCWHWHAESFRNSYLRFSTSLQPSPWVWKWLGIKKLPSASKTEREKGERILCLQLIWGYGLLASALQTDFSKWKCFIISLWRESQTCWKMWKHAGKSTVDCKKQKSRNLKICHRGRDFKNLLYVMQMSKMLIHHLKYIFFSYIYVCIHTYTCMWFWGKLQIVLPQYGGWWQEGNLHVETHLSWSKSNHSPSPNAAAGQHCLPQPLPFHSPSTQKLFYNLPAISQGFRVPFRCIVWLCPKQTCTSGLWTIFLPGFPSCHHLLILFDLQPLLKANKQNLTTS